MRTRREIKTWSTPVTEEERSLIPCTLCGGTYFVPQFTCAAPSAGGEAPAPSQADFSYVRCAGCGLVQINPQPLKDTVFTRYREGSGDEYLAYETANEDAFLHLQELALGDAGFYGLETSFREEGRAAPRVLDIGCATGALLAKLRDRGWSVQGVEISTPQAEYGRLKRGLDISVLPLGENRFPEQSFDLVLASHLIEHLNDPGAFIREVHRILAPGGRFFVTTPNIAGFQGRFFQDRWRSAIFDHLYLFSVKTLKALLIRHGFGTEKIVTWGGLAAGIAPAPVKGVFDWAAKRSGFGDVMLIRAKKREG